MHRFLLSFRSLSNFRLQYELARRLSGLGHGVDFVYEGGEDVVFDALRHDASALGAQLVAFDAFLTQVTASAPLRRRAPRRLRSHAAEYFARRNETGRVFLDVHGRALAAGVAILAQLQPDALIVNEDGVSGHLALIAAARDRDVTVIDVPFGFFLRSEFDGELARKEALGELRRPEPPHQRMMTWLAPQWLKQGRFAGAIMFPDMYILAAEAMGITLRDAWTVHGGLSDVLCAESEQAAETYRKEGVRARKIALTGSPYGDVMFDALAADDLARRAFRQAITIEPDRTRILVSWPPSYHETRRGLSEFASYEEMTRTVLRFLKGIPNAQLTLSIHPAAGPEAQRIAIEEGVTPTQDYVIALIPKHDIFVTSFSSTIRWATAAGKPVVNYDAYQWRFDHFQSGGFFNEKDYDGFCKRIKLLASSPQAFRDAAEAQCRDATRWGIVDGSATGRIADALERLPR
jgi:hypothetical protein